MSDRLFDFETHNWNFRHNWNFSCNCLEMSDRLFDFETLLPIPIKKRCPSCLEMSDRLLIVQLLRFFNFMEITIGKTAAVWRLRKAWQKVRKKGSAGGVDGVTVQQFDKKAEANIISLSKDILSDRYIPEPLQHIQKQKSGGRGKRNLGLPSIKDKIVQNSLSALLGEMYEPLFSNCSYAYRPGKGAIKAVTRVRDFLSRKNQWVSTIDIDDFFDTVNHKICLSLLSEKILDKKVLRLIKLYLSNGVLKHDRWEDTYDGIPQGGVLSLVLNNIYLNEFDKGS